jgi:hypothetical protein
MYSGHLCGAINFGRVIYHFREYDLANRFSVQAGSELASLRKELLIDFRTGGVNEVQNVNKKGSSLKKLELTLGKQQCTRRCLPIHGFQRAGIIKPIIVHKKALIRAVFQIFKVIYRWFFSSVR